MKFSLLLSVLLAAEVVEVVGAFSLRLQRTQRLTELRASKKPSRRDVLVDAGGVALASLTLGSPLAAAEEPRTIVMTGANSGIGLEACKLLAGQGHDVVLACRTLDKAKEAVQKLQGLGSGKMIPAECDLASLASIKAFAKKLPSLTSSKIDALCLNAGISLNTGDTEALRTSDGFELTVGTNHFGHFYLNHLLLPLVKPSTGRVVVTASGVHDPASPGGAQGVPAALNDMKGLAEQGKSCEMIDGNGYNADKAYKDSKLCNVLFTRELQRRLDSNASTKGITANCFSPGLIVGTGLFRNQNPVFTKLFDVAATGVFKVGETPEWGGACLDYMTRVDTRGKYYNSPPGTSKYGAAALGNQFTVETVSKEAQDDAKAKRLWELSEQVLEISA